MVRSRTGGPAAVIAVVAMVAAALATVVAGSPAMADPVVVEVAPGSEARNVRVTPDGQLLVVLAGEQLRTVDPATGDTVSTISSNVGEVPGFRISADSQTVVFKRVGGGQEELVAAALDGSGEEVLATAVPGQFLQFDIAEAAGRVVYGRLDTGSFTADYFSAPIDASAAGITLVTDVSLTDTVVLAGNHLVYGDGSNDAGIDAVHVATAAPVVVETDARLLSQPLEPAGLNTATGPYVLFSILFDAFVTTVGGSRLDISGDPTTVSFDIGATASAAGADDQVVVDLLDGTFTWVIDTSSLPGISTHPMLTADGSGVVWTQLNVPSDYTGWYWAPLDTGDGAPTPVAVPGSADVVPADMVISPIGVVVYPGAQVAGGRPYQVWTPGEPTAASTPVAPWPSVIGDPDVPAWKVTSDGATLLVTGNQSELVRLDLVNPSTDAVVLQDTPLTVVGGHTGAGGAVIYSLVDATACADVQVSCFGPTRLWKDVPPPPSASMKFPPERLLDTRPTGVTVDGTSQAEGAIGSAGNDPFANRVYRLAVGGRAGLPSDADAYVLNVAAVNPTGNGFVSVYPCLDDPPGPPDPLVATLNFRAGPNAVANNTIVGHVAGNVCVYVSTAVHVVIDAAGWFPAGSDFEPGGPTRLVDTREGAQVVAGGISGGGNDQALDVLVVPVASLAGVPADAEAVAVNLAAVAPVASGFATLWSCDQPMPPTASLNFPAGVNAIANATVVGIAPSGQDAGAICVHTNVASHLVIDITGWFPAGARYVATAPARAMDTRVGDQFGTVDGQHLGEGMLGVTANSTSRSYELTIAGRAGVPALDVGAVALNVVGVAPVASGFMSVTPGPCPQDPPTTATVNVTAGVPATANGVVVGLGPSGTVCIYANVDLHVVVDVTGYVPGGG